MIEEEIFKRRKVLFDKLETYGFIRMKENYVIEKPFFDGMVAKVTVDPLGTVSGKVYDEELREEYVNHRNPAATGAFVGGVRAAYERLLTEIAQAVTSETVYIGDQANRVNDLIYHEYGVSPEFLWEKFPHFGVYRNVSSRKWFAIIMNVGKGKVVPGAEGQAEVMNLKLDARVEEYLGEGVYPSYHMNHKSWVSVLLDGTVPDGRVAEMIRISFDNSKKK